MRPSGLTKVCDFSLLTFSCLFLRFRGGKSRRRCSFDEEGPVHQLSIDSEDKAGLYGLWLLQRWNVQLPMYFEAGKLF